MRENILKLCERTSLLELGKDFIELKDIELKDRKVKIKREIEEVFFEPIIASIDDVDRFEKNINEENEANKNT